MDFISIGVGGFNLKTGKRPAKRKAKPESEAAIKMARDAARTNRVDTSAIAYYSRDPGAVIGRESRIKETYDRIRKGIK